MRAALAAAAGTCLTLGIASASASSTAVDSAKLRADLTINVKMTSNGGVYLYGRTNLPDRTQLLVGVASASWALGNHPKRQDEYLGQTKTSVRHGRWRSAVFTDNYGPLRHGKYQGSAAMPLAELQTSSVRAVIGAHGQRLTGPLVTRDAIGTTVERNVLFTLR